ncbi:hypothetical protein ACFWP7_34170 [Streptomyces sp. NPDC058470]|uniref:hypothetical protein n=1 Tax=Streptomyces sp. NPDC058470 TaxID=3346515 RepID=UPI0036551019
MLQAADAAMDELVRTAVVSRPLDDVVHLVTLLEQTPDGVAVAAKVLRLAAVARSVDDVTRLVELLGSPPHRADRMDEAIRVAAEQRPVAEVGRLLFLLHRPPHDPHTGTEAVRAAATGRPLEDLVQLLGHLGEDRATGTGTGGAEVWDTDTTATGRIATGFATGPGAATEGSRSGRSLASRTAGGSDPVRWLRRLAGVLVLLCAAAHLPLHWADAPSRGLVAALGVAACCLALGVVLVFSGKPVVAAACAAVTGALAIAPLLDGRVGSPTLSYVLDPGGVVHPLPALSAGVAALASLIVLAVTVTRRQTAGERRMSLPG